MSGLSGFVLARLPFVTHTNTMSDGAVSLLISSQTLAQSRGFSMEFWTGILEVEGLRVVSTTATAPAADVTAEGSGIEGFGAGTEVQV